MDFAKISALLEQHLQASQRERTMLEDLVALHEEELARARKNEAALARALAALEGDPSDVPDVPGEPTPLEPVPDTARRIAWPSGRDCVPLKPKRAHRWARAKLESADWYLSILAESGSAEGIAHDLGSEMAVAGAIECMGACFDTAIYALTAAIERGVDIPEDRRTPPPLTSWAKAFAEARLFDFDLSCRGLVSEAMVGEYSPSPSGWLAQLQLLRNRMIREDPLVADEDAELGNVTGRLAIDVPGRGRQDPLEYLQETRERIGNLFEHLSRDVKSVKQQAKTEDRKRAPAADAARTAPPV